MFTLTCIKVWILIMYVTNTRLYIVAKKENGQIPDVSQKIVSADNKLRLIFLQKLAYLDTSINI